MTGTDFNLGGYNDWPPNMKPSTASEFWCQVNSWGYGQIERRQPIVGRAVNKSDPTYPNDPSSVHVHTYEDSSGFVVALVTTENGIKRRFFTFAACNHKYEMTHQRVCYSEQTCKICGHKYAIDSS